MKTVEQTCGATSDTPTLALWGPRRRREKEKRERTYLNKKSKKLS